MHTSAVPAKMRSHPSWSSGFHLHLVKCADRLIELFEIFFGDKWPPGWCLFLGWGWRDGDDSYFFRVY